MAKTSDAQMRAVAKWAEKNQEQLNVKLKKGTKETWKVYCDQLGESMSGLISKAVEEYVERHLSQ